MAPRMLAALGFPHGALPPLHGTPRLLISRRAEDLRAPCAAATFVIRGCGAAISACCFGGSRGQLELATMLRLHEAVRLSGKNSTNN
jgi:hypothetical protein